MKNIIIEKKFLLGIRIVSILCALFLTGIEVSNQIEIPIFSDNTVNYHSLLRLVGNSFVIILSALLALYPQKLGFITAASFYYAFVGTVFEINNPMGICMFFLGISVLYIRGEFFINTKRRIFLIILFYIAIILSELRFGIKVFFNELLFKTAYTIVLGIPTFLFIETVEYHRNPRIENSKILNLANYHGLVKNDILLLKEVLEKKQYKEIAMDLYRAEGTVRNRLNKIYDILGVMDRMGFISTYMGYEIVFQSDPYTSEHEKHKTLLYKKKKKKKKKKK